MYGLSVTSPSSRFVHLCVDSARLDFCVRDIKLKNSMSLIPLQ
jgi:hypothetical protein